MGLPQFFWPTSGSAGLPHRGGMEASPRPIFVIPPGLLTGFLVREGCKRTSGRATQPMRSKSVIQLVSQVLPPSAENACSQWHEVAVISDQMTRHQMCLPSQGSCE